MIIQATARLVARCPAGLVLPPAPRTLDCSMTTPSALPTTIAPCSGVLPLPHLGVIRASGEEAVKFLQGQLTQDIAALDAAHAGLAAFCNAKGRMQASFVVFKLDATDVLLVCAQDLLATTLKRLSMFVMRAKVKLSDASADFLLYGIAGNAIDSIAPSAHPAWSKVTFDTQNVIFLYPGAGVARALWCAPVGTATPAGPALPLAHWQWLEVQSGVAMIQQPIFEAFVPQMLNYESVGGVNFKKGCYPGQEIVARSQFRGTLKRRAYLAHSAGQPHVGQAVFHASDAEQPCGLVAAAAAHPDGGFDAIVSMQTSAAADADNGQLTLGTASDVSAEGLQGAQTPAAAAPGAGLQLLALPYALLEDI